MAPTCLKNDSFKTMQSIKQFLSLLLFPAVFFSAHSQSFLHFPDPNGIWKYEEFQADPGQGCTRSTVEVVGVDRDSIFNGHLYYHFRELDRGFCAVQNSGCTNEIDKLSGWVRTDTATGKSYLYDANLQQDTLIYDVSLSVGDTFRSALTWAFGTTDIVTSVDTIVIGGLPRRRVIVLSDWDFIEYFMVEGMGSSAGPLVHLGGNVDEDYSQLQCYGENNVALWTNFVGCSGAGGCFYALVGADEGREGEVELGPNPFSETLRIRWEAGRGKNASLQLYGLDGRLYWEKAWAGEATQEIDLKELPSGMYLLRLHSPFGTKNFRVIRIYQGL